MMVYEANNVEVLEDTEHVRERAEMYIGSRDKEGLHHLVWELINNSVDEYLAGYCDEIVVELHRDGSISVRDNGRGIPVNIHKKYKKPAIEIVFTVLGSGSKFGRGAYKYSGGLHGVGLTVVNALSEWLECIVWRDGYEHRIKFSRGKVTEPLSKQELTDNKDRTGTYIRFKPDREMFETTEFDFNLIKQKCRILSYLNRGLKFVLINHNTNEEVEYKSDKGISELLNELIGNRQPLLENNICFEAEEGSIKVQVCFNFVNSYDTEKYESFVNGIHTVEGGTHVNGFRSGLVKAITDLMNQIKLKQKVRERIQPEDIRKGIIAVVNCLVSEPSFKGQTKTELRNREVHEIVRNITIQELTQLFSKKKNLLRTIVDKAIRFAEIRERIKLTKESARITRKSVFSQTILPGKLADCIEHDIDNSELFIVEGESAGGSAKQARDKRFQAVLPLRGKILNVEKATLKKIYQNEEIQALITSIGTGIGDSFDYSKLRYGKIIIMTDADIDGSHIRVLLLTLFFRFLKPLIEKGHVYIAIPPLYKVKFGKQYKYVKNEAELKQLISELEQKGMKYEVQRFKGLGEMNPEQLWETTMNPETRKLKRVSIEDAEIADRIFETLLSTDVNKRREFIFEYAGRAKNIDI